jgi:hypothetical protein
MKKGEFKSVRAAALEAGIVKRTLTIPLDPEGAARILRKHLGPDERAQICSLLNEE